MEIRPAQEKDKAAIYSIIEPVIRSGETYALNPRMNQAEALAYWFDSDKTTFVAEENGLIVGTYYIRANQAGGGSHVCNCGYMTAANATGKGIARRMCEHSITYAKMQGYKAMQFNFVVSSNTRAVKLWQSLDFEIIGTLPKAFNHPINGYVDAFVMFKNL